VLLQRHRRHNVLQPYEGNVLSFHGSLLCACALSGHACSTPRFHTTAAMHGTNTHWAASATSCNITKGGLTQAFTQGLSSCDNTSNDTRAVVASSSGQFPRRECG